MRHRASLNFSGSQIGDVRLRDVAGHDVRQRDDVQAGGDVIYGVPPAQLLQVGKEIAGTLTKLTAVIAVQSLVSTLMLVMVIGLLVFEDRDVA